MAWAMAEAEVRLEQAARETPRRKNPRCEGISGVRTSALIWLFALSIAILLNVSLRKSRKYDDQHGVTETSRSRFLAMHERDIGCAIFAAGAVVFGYSLGVLTGVSVTVTAVVVMFLYFRLAPR